MIYREEPFEVFYVGIAKTRKEPSAGELPIVTSSPFGAAQKASQQRPCKSLNQVGKRVQNVAARKQVFVGNRLKLHGTLPFQMATDGKGTE